MTVGRVHKKNRQQYAQYGLRHNCDYIRNKTNATLVVLGSNMQKMQFKLLQEHKQLSFRAKITPCPEKRKLLSKTTQYESARLLLHRLFVSRTLLRKKR